jgi:hypothetical protein
VVLAGWVSLWVFWAFGVMDREELVATMMMTGYDLAFCGLFQYLSVMNECVHVLREYSTALSIVMA